MEGSNVVLALLFAVLGVLCLSGAAILLYIWLLRRQLRIPKHVVKINQYQYVVPSRQYLFNLRQAMEAGDFSEVAFRTLTTNLGYGEAFEVIPSAPSADRFDSSPQPDHLTCVRFSDYEKWLQDPNVELRPIKAPKKFLTRVGV